MMTIREVKGGEEDDYKEDDGCMIKRESVCELNQTLI